MSECLSDDLLQAAVEGRLPAGSDAYAHLAACRVCRAVVALSLSGSRDAQGALDSRVTVSVDAARAETIAPAAPVELLKRGQTIGRYLILGQLGAGGMGVVYAAYDTELDRRIAIKLLKPKGNDEDLAPRRARLLAEAQSMARLTHPNVIRVYDVGVHGDSLFIAMEIVDGTTLAGWLKAQPRTWREIVAKLVAAGRGLAAAHEAGIVHRDFKPANVLVSADGEVFVTDFGLARFEPRQSLGPDLEGRVRSSSSSDITEQGVIVGTLNYMAPEVFLGEAATVRSDIFSFGVALYEALYGALPFERNALGDIREALLHGPPGLSRRSVPRWLRREIVRALDAKPEARQPSIRALTEALARDRTRTWRRVAAVAAVSGLVAAGVAAFSTSPPDVVELCRGAGDEAQRIWNEALAVRTRAAFMATKRPAAADAFTLVEKAFARWQVAYASQQRELCAATRLGTQVPTLLERRTACLDKRRLEASALVDLFQRADGPLVERARAVADQLAQIAACEDLAALSTPIPPPSEAQREGVLAARAELARSVALATAGKDPEALAAAKVALDKATATGHTPTVAECRAELARVVQRLGPFEDAIAPWQETGWEAIAVHDDALAVEAALGIAQIRGTQQSRFDDARGELHFAQALLSRMGGDLQLEVNLHNTIGQMAYREGKFAEAVGEYRLALDLRRRLDATRRDGPPMVTTAENALRNNLANALVQLGAFAESLAEHETVLASRLAGEGPMHPAVANTYNNMGQVYVDQFRYREALEVYEKSLSLRKLLLPPDHWLIGLSEANLGMALAGLGENESALAHIEHGLLLMEKKIGLDNPDVAALATEVASVQLELGAVADAEANLARAFDVLAKSVGMEHAQAARTHEVHGALLMARGDAAGALEAYIHAVAITAEARPGALAIQAPLAGAGAALVVLGDPEAAEVLLGRAQALGPGDALVDGDVAFALARARVLEGAEDEGRALVAAAKERYRAAPTGAKRIALLETWWSEH